MHSLQVLFSFVVLIHFPHELQRTIISALALSHAVKASYLSFFLIFLESSRWR
jgi:hypothetical protein